MTDCIFCKIIEGQIPSAKVYEDDKVYAFLDITQATPGHTLVIPKEHVSDIFQYDAQLAGEVFSRIPKIAKAIMGAYPQAKGMNLINNNGQVAYQSVFHSHFHLIPRYSSDDPGFAIKFEDHSADFPSEKLQEIATNIAKHIDE
ncbi:HIT family protein [Eremococcus coleocola]|uniref:Histidine triad domain protein n=1 Tax=Eremococcus coleocola ACS-139-V-Col8 TaxID=908337 RepID=E4KQ77_9LACT|nr:HIT family protein [Eremococcus coleocola]EFR30904.1 histidine triad domain protein [Eremococcus coleocola ACS-139-V-Col8]